MPAFRVQSSSRSAANFSWKVKAQVVAFLPVVLNQLRSGSRHGDDGGGHVEANPIGLVVVVNAFTVIVLRHKGRNDPLATGATSEHTSIFRMVGMPRPANFTGLHMIAEGTGAINAEAAPERQVCVGLPAFQFLRSPAELAILSGPRFARACYRPPVAFRISSNCCNRFFGIGSLRTLISQHSLKASSRRSATRACVSHIRFLPLLWPW